MPSFPSRVAAAVRPFAFSALAVTMLSTLALPAAAQVALSEIRIDQPGGDDDEYFELAGAPGTTLAGLTYLVIGDGAAAAGSGVIEAVVNLTGSSIGAGGFFVAAESTFSLGTADLVTSLNFENSDNVTHLVVSGFVGANGQDLDTNDDGVLDSTPWSAQLDCVALIETVGSGDLTYCATTVGPDGAFVPGHAFDCPEGWQIGAFDPAGGADTPGAANACPQAEATLSEIRIDQPGTDDDEYFELAGPNGGPLSGLTYLVIGDGAAAAGSGVIEVVVDLTGSSLSGSGFFVAAESTFSLGTADLTTSLNFENGDNVTHLVVRDFSGANGQDLDTNDDGVLDSTPWSEQLDCVALLQSTTSGDLTYCATTVGPDGSFVPGHAYLCPEGWQIGPFGLPGDDTPGAANACAPPPTGGDLVINEIDYDQPGTDTAEFIEIKNVGTDPVDLSAFALELVNGTGGGASVYQTIALPAVSLAAGDYFVVCANAATVLGCDLDVSPNTNLVQNGGPDAVALVSGGSIVDTVSYEGDTGAPYTEGSGAGLEDDSSGGTGGPNENKSISRLPDGVDTDQNNLDFSLRCATPGAANSAATSDCPSVAPPVLVINEIDYDQPGSDTAEFVEIKNAGNGAVSLAGVELVLVNGTGGGAAVYNTIALPAVTLAAGDYFVVCGDAATVVECDLDVSPSSNLVQNGAPDAVALVAGGVIVDAVSYEGDTGAPYTEGSGSGLEDSGSTGEDNKGIGRFPDGTDSDQNNADLVNACITPGRPNTSLAAGCGPRGPVLEIYEIQSAGASTPFDNQTVTTLDNVVTAVGLDGFFIQTPAARTDGDVDTSDGIFVFTAGPPTVAVGELVDVTGTADEFFGFTEISGFAVVDPVGVGTVPAPVAFGASVPSPDPTAPSCAIEYECYEGMVVSVTGGAVSGPNQRFGPDPIAEAHVVADSTRAFREPGIEFPGIGGLPVWDGNPEVFELDPDKLGLPNAVIPAGSTYSATGPLGFEFGGYEIWPYELSFTPAALPVPVRLREPGELTVGSLNLFRLFDDVDDPPSVNFQGQTRDDAVVSTAEYQTRLDKFCLYIDQVLDSPDVLAVQEAESLKVLQDLADHLAADADCGAFVGYTPYLVEGNDVGTIDVGFLVRDSIVVDAVTQLGLTETFTNPVTGDEDLLHDRPPLLLEGACTAGGGESQIKVIVVHNRSLGSIEDPVQGPRVREKRLQQARSIAVKVQALQDGDPDVPLVVTGDFNAFEFTDGYVDAVGRIAGDFDDDDDLVVDPDDLVNPDLDNQVLSLPPEERYSFIFGGSAQVLDHALTSQGLAPFVRGFEYGRGNADAALILLDDPSTPLRSSDHDGLVLYVAKDSDGDGVPDELDVCPGTEIPEGVPTDSLGVNRYALVDGDGVFDTVLPPGGGPGDVFTLDDTGGCSCEQIIDAQGLGNGHRKHGCSVGAMRNWVELVNP